MASAIRGDDIDRMMDDVGSTEKGGEQRRSRSPSGSRSRRPAGRKRTSRQRSPRRSPPRRRTRSRSPRRRRPLTAEEEAQKRLEREQREIERDRRTVFASQLHPRVDEKDVFEFFSQCGRVRDVQLIRDNRTNKSKGLCYVEFGDKESVSRALAFSGQLLGGYPISVQVTQSEKNRAAAAAVAAQMDGPMRLYISNFSKQITEDDLSPIFSAFGELDFLEIRKDQTTKGSLGCGFVQYQKGSEAREALEQLNGISVLGQVIKVSQIDGSRPAALSGQETGIAIPGLSTSQLDEGTGGMQFTAQSRHMLMQRLHQSAGLGALPPSASVAMPNPTNPLAALVTQMPPSMSSEFVQLQNMFNPATETEPEWDEDVKEDVQEECSKFGKVLHVHVDRNSNGHVFLKFDSTSAAQAAVSALNGRWFAQKQIIAGFVMQQTYEQKFPESRSSVAGQAP